MCTCPGHVPLPLLARVCVVFGPGRLRVDRRRFATRSRRRSSFRGSVHSSCTLPHPGADLCARGGMQGNGRSHIEHGHSSSSSEAPRARGTPSHVPLHRARRLLTNDDFRRRSALLALECVVGGWRRLRDRDVRVRRRLHHRRRRTRTRRRSGRTGRRSRRGSASSSIGGGCTTGGGGSRRSSVDGRSRRG